MNSEEAAHILGVPVDAKIAELNKAWRKVSRTCHPDLHPGDAKAEKKFRRINTAFTTLTSIHEGARRMRDVGGDIVDNEFDRWLERLDPEKQGRIRKELAELEKEDESH